MKFSTIGFTKKSARRFFDMLRASGAKRVVDVRLNTGSQLSGFAKKDDLAWFLDEICGIEYVHLPSLAPTKELLSDYRKKQIDWDAYETRFLELMRQRRIEETVSRAALDEGCLLCSEDQPHHCHRRLVAEYLDEHWGGVQIEHLGISKPATDTLSAVADVERADGVKVIRVNEGGSAPARSKAMTREEREDLLKEILLILNRRKVRATYSAVACILEMPPQSLGREWLGRPRPWASWVVGKGNGEPTGYDKSKKHPDLYRKTEWMKSCCELRKLLGRPLPKLGTHGRYCGGGC